MGGEKEEEAVEHKRDEGQERKYHAKAKDEDYQLSLVERKSPGTHGEKACLIYTEASNFEEEMDIQEIMDKTMKLLNPPKDCLRKS